MRIEYEMKVCCWDKLDCNFCPDCGGRIEHHPLFGLLSHVRKTASNQQMRILNIKKAGCAEAVVNRQQDKLESTWLAWRNALESMLKEYVNTKGHAK